MITPHHIRHPFSLNWDTTERNFADLPSFTQEETEIDRISNCLDRFQGGYGVRTGPSMPPVPRGTATFMATQKGRPIGALADETP